MGRQSTSLDESSLLGGGGCQNPCFLAGGGSSLRRPTPGRLKIHQPGSLIYSGGGSERLGDSSLLQLEEKGASIDGLSLQLGQAMRSCRVSLPSAELEVTVTRCGLSWKIW